MRQGAMMAKVVEQVTQDNFQYNERLKRVSGQPLLWEYNYKVVDSDNLESLNMKIQEEDEFFPLTIQIELHKKQPDSVSNSKKISYRFINSQDAINTIDDIFHKMERMSIKDLYPLKSKIYAKIPAAERLELILTLLEEDELDKPKVEEAIRIAELLPNQNIYIKLADRIKELGLHDEAAYLYRKGEIEGRLKTISDFNALLETDELITSIDQQLIVNALKVIDRPAMQELLSNFYQSTPLMQQLAEAFTLCGEKEFAILLYERILSSWNDDYDPNEIQSKLADLLQPSPDAPNNQSLLEENKRLHEENERLREQIQQLKLQLQEASRLSNLGHNSIWSKEKIDDQQCERIASSFLSIN